MLNPFFLLLSPPLVSSLLSFHPPRGSARPLSFISIFQISHTLLLPSRPSLFPLAFHPLLASHVLEPVATENSDMQPLYFFWSCCFVVIRRSSLSHPFLFLPFHQPRSSHPQHHCWSWILRSFQAKRRQPPSPPPSFSTHSYPFPPDLAVYPLVQWCKGHEQSAKRCLLQLMRVGNLTGGDVFHGLCAARLWLAVATGASGAGKPK